MSIVKNVYLKLNNLPSTRPNNNLNLKNSHIFYNKLKRMMKNMQEITLKNRFSMPKPVSFGFKRYLAAPNKTRIN